MTFIFILICGIEEIMLKSIKQLFRRINLKICLQYIKYDSGFHFWLMSTRNPIFHAVSEMAVVVDAAIITQHKTFDVMWIKNCGKSFKIVVNITNFGNLPC